MNKLEEKYYNVTMLLEFMSKDRLLCEDEGMSDKVRQMILSDNCWIRNDYESFVKSVDSNSDSPFYNHLTNYTADELRDANVQTFQLDGFSIGFALKPLEDGNIDIISVHNNESKNGVHGISDAMLTIAKKHGGNQLDHFEGKLSDIYDSNGFEEYGRYTWDDQYAPQNWNYDMFSTPDVVLRRLPKEETNESLNLLLRMKLI